MTCRCTEIVKTGLDVARKLVTGERATVDEAQRRRAICTTCQLLTLHFGKHVLTCGRLFDGTPRDAARDGCGCIIMIKAALSGERCPRGRWEAPQSSPPLNNSLQ